MKKSYIFMISIFLTLLFSSCSESNKEKEQYSENVNSLRLKKSPYFKPLKPLIKRTTTNYSLQL